jgi:hypothetical protein
LFYVAGSNQTTTTVIKTWACVEAPAVVEAVPVVSMRTNKEIWMQLNQYVVF